MNFILLEAAGETTKAGIVIDPVWALTAMVAVVGAGLGYFLVRIDNDVRKIFETMSDHAASRDAHKARLDKLECDTERGKDEMSAIREALLKIIGKSKLRKRYR